MKKATLYILITVCLLGIILLLVFRQPDKKLDTRVTLDKKYKNPYGLEVAFSALPLLFNNASVKVNNKSPEDWYDSDSCADGKSVFFLISRHFNPNNNELRELFEFVKQGNQVFVCTPELDEDARDYFGIGEEWGYDYENGYLKDSGTAKLSMPPFAQDSNFFNPGFHYTTYFSGVDSVHYRALGKDETGYTNFIKVSAGKGSFYFHSNPFLFDNYFLLHGNNLHYLQNIASLIPADKNKIIWDEYFLYKGRPDSRSGSPSPLHVLFQYPSFTWAFLIILFLLAIYVATNLKRTQRLINIVIRPKNDTLDFTKTIGRLYFEKNDHTNLAKKMATYLLEYIRNRYFIGTASLDEEFMKSLASKSGYDEESVKEITGQLIFIQGNNKVSEQRLGNIYQSFSKFYKYTS